MKSDLTLPVHDSPPIDFKNIPIEYTQPPTVILSSALTGTDTDHTTIYLLTNNISNKRIIMVKSPNDLPLDDTHTFGYANNIEHCYTVNNKFFIEVSLIPNNLQGTEEEVQTIAKNYFSGYIVKKFDSKDFFSAYLIYTMSN